jgi:hypothetical protein
MNDRAPQPCHKCGQPGAGDIGTQGWCLAHRNEFYARCYANLAMYEQQRYEDQRTALLTPPEIPADTDEDEVMAAMRLWADDLWVGVQTGHVTRTEAEHLLRAATAT